MTARPRLVSLANLPAYARECLDASTGFPQDGLVANAFGLPGLDLHVQSADRAFSRLCENTIVAHAGAARPGIRADVRVLHAGDRHWPEPAAWDVATGFTSREFDTVLAREGLRGFYYHDAPSWQFYDPVARKGVHTMPHPMAIAPWETGSPLRLFLHWASASAGMRLTHAATLGTGNRGALIVGASGSGKSGTTLAGYLHGLTTAGDDYVLVDEGPTVTAHAVYRGFKQDEAGLARAGLDVGRIGDATLNWRGKYEFDAMTFRPDAFVGTMPVNAILLPAIARLPRTRIEPVPAKVAALALAPSAVFQLPGDADDAFTFFARLTRQLPAFRVLLSEDPAEIADAIGNHLERGVARDH